MLKDEIEGKKQLLQWEKKLIQIKLTQWWNEKKI